MLVHPVVFNTDLPTNRRTRDKNVRRSNILKVCMRYKIKRTMNQTKNQTYCQFLKIKKVRYAEAEKSMEILRNRKLHVVNRIIEF